VPDQIFDSRDVLIRDFNPAPRRYFHVQRELPGIGAGEKGPAQEWINRQTPNEDAE
jgi:hypothetical protein